MGLQLVSPQAGAAAQLGRTLLVGTRSKIRRGVAVLHPAVTTGRDPRRTASAVGVGRESGLIALVSLHDCDGCLPLGWRRRLPTPACYTGMVAMALCLGLGLPALVCGIVSGNDAPIGYAGIGAGRRAGSAVREVVAGHRMFVRAAVRAQHNQVGHIGSPSVASAVKEGLASGVANKRLSAVSAK